VLDPVSLTPLALLLEIDTDDILSVALLVALRAPSTTLSHRSYQRAPQVLPRLLGRRSHAKGQQKLPQGSRHQERVNRNVLHWAYGSLISFLGFGLELIRLAGAFALRFRISVLIPISVIPSILIHLSSVFHWG
jgi:hypothetical protein